MGLTRKLIQIVDGEVSVDDDELSKLIEIAGRNKILLGFLRRINNATRLRLFEEEKIC